LCGQMGHFASNCEGKPKKRAGESDEKGDGNDFVKKPYQVEIHNQVHNTRISRFLRYSLEV